uniref:Uncharacterized protein n=1 Tax=Nelumbo nucifera TaxID=4432 RepID=A0A822ZE92_NELNU|nr:TPA_asm: hypothetical protein HUJ06_016092 [Nelumbo nucifera]
MQEGPRTFVSAASMPVKSQNVKPNGPSNRSMDVGEPNVIRFKDTASAAQAAAESAKKAIAAAQAAAHLANMNSHQVTEQINMENWSSNRDVLESQTGDHSVPRDPPVVSQNRSHQSSLPGRLNESSYLSDEEEEEGGSANLVDGRKFHRRHSHNVPPEHSDIKFDDSDGLDSDCNEEIDMEMPSGGINPPPPNRSPPPIPTAHAYQPDDRTTKFASCKQDSVPHLHPKLPDYDALAARFEALKNRKS